MISPGEGGSDDNSDGPKVLQSNPPLSGKALLSQQYLGLKQNDTTMNVPGDNVVTDVISPGGGESVTANIEYPYIRNYGTGSPVNSKLRVHSRM